MQIIKDPDLEEPKNIWVRIRSTVYYKWLAKYEHRVLVRRIKCLAMRGRWSTSVTTPPPALLRHSPALGRSSKAVSSTSQVKSHSSLQSKVFGFLCITEMLWVRIRSDPDPVGSGTYLPGRIGIRYKCTVSGCV
jgi:hypothetical protein